jgi:UDP-N-acetylmuramoyl-L-alanyl-D-glutamate--2,6-diaminopimelate ligase
MHDLLQLIRSLLPPGVMDAYHRLLSWAAAVRYGHPSKQLVVIGITGTSGKTTTAYLVSKLLEVGGAKTGMMSTAFFKIDDRVWENRTKMTMLGRFQTQKMLRDMVNAGCRYAVVETTSQGIVQHRHEHVAYDVVMLTNLWPEHVEAHGSFAAYKKAKQQLFFDVARLPRKQLEGAVVPRVEILNVENEHAKDFVVEGFDRVVWFGHGGDLAAEGVELSVEGSRWSVRGIPVDLHLPGTVNIDNALAAVAVIDALGLSVLDATHALSSISGLPGRYERIDMGQPFTVIVDYAFEPGAVAKLYELVSMIPHHRIIHVLGSTGGGRDVARRPVLGGMAGKNADVVIVTNEDPYDDDPLEIIDQVAEGALRAGRQDGVDLFRIEDRGDAIRQAILMAQPDDIVLVTGKGSEPVMAVAGGRKVPWSDVNQVKAAIARAVKV